MTTNSAEEASKPLIVLPSGNPTINDSRQDIFLKDNGIFDFVTPERAIELYKRIHSSGIPDLEWKFYGRRKPGEPEKEEKKESNGDEEWSQKSDENQKEIINTEFDFDEEFSDLKTDTPTVNDSLQLKKRPEPGSEKKTNLNDIMSDIMKETNHTETE